MLQFTKNLYFCTSKKVGGRTPLDIKNGNKKTYKIMKEQFRLNVVLSACGEITFDASRTEMLTKDAEKALAEIITGDFLHAMIHVPEQDLQYFLADLPDGLWSELVRQYEMTEEIPVP